MEPKLISVGFGEYKVSQDPDSVLVVYGLGSCIGLSLYDPKAKVGGVIHIGLPYNEKKSKEKAFKYADTGIPLLVREIERIGGNRKRLAAKAAGGAKLLKFNYPIAQTDIGSRNTQATRATLEKLTIRLLAEDVGGTFSRTFKFYLRNGLVLIRSMGGEHPL
ncbi:MAG: chemotaxis protein CheD [Armatimonadetes bacterium]|nr:chemotaxis protein CheD [Armatimonadota bacterium]